MRALVTGGAGFIGSNLVDALLDRADEVLVVDTLRTGRRENLEGALSRGAVLHEIDVRDRDGLARLMSDHGTEVVFHLAAQIDVRHSVADPAEDAEVNVGGMIALLDAARASGVRRLVYSSTGGAIYGESDTHPTPEDAPRRPLAPYGQSKYAAEGYCALYERLHGLSSVSLRYANVYGPRQDPLGEGGVIAIFCGCLRDGRRPTVFGDGRQTRDYTFVGDVVAANLLAAESAVTGAYNVGTGIETSVLELLEAFAPLASRRAAPGEGGAPGGSAGSLEAIFAAARPGEVLRSVLDPSAARAALNWRPTTPLDEGLRLTLADLT